MTIRWRNSIVYHDFDKITSIYIHIVPSMLTYAMRWNTLPDHVISPIGMSDMVRASLVYLLWQSLYYYKTEVVDKPKLDSDPSLLTSLRWLASDKKNSTARMVLKLLKVVGVCAPDEEYDASSVKTKLIFITSQFIYTCCTFLPTPFFYHNKNVHISFIAFIFVTAVYNGACYYMEIFSKRYQLKFIEKEQMQQVAEAAAIVAIEAVNKQYERSGVGGTSNVNGSSGNISGSGNFEVALGVVPQVKEEEGARVNALLSSEATKEIIHLQENGGPGSSTGIQIRHCEVVGGDEFAGGEVCDSIDSGVLEREKEQKHDDDNAHGVALGDSGTVNHAIVNIIQQATSDFMDKFEEDANDVSKENLFRDEVDDDQEDTSDLVLVERVSDTDEEVRFGEELNGKCGDGDGGGGGGVDILIPSDETKKNN